MSGALAPQTLPQNYDAQILREMMGKDFKFESRDPDDYPNDSYCKDLKLNEWITESEDDEEDEDEDDIH